MKNLFAQNMRDDNPVTPLPNPGEGGAVNPGTENGNPEGNRPDMGNRPGMGNRPSEGNMMPGINRPTIPLPNPGEGGAAFPGGSNFPTGGQLPGGSLFPGGNVLPGGNWFPAVIGTIITSFPRPGSPCRFCQNQNQNAGTMRILNAAAGYNPFRIYVDDQLFVSSLNFSELTSYERVPAGYRIITVMGENDYIYIQKPVMIPQENSVTIAICNTQSGLDLFVISDASCSKSNYLSCLRICNLSYNGSPLTVILGNNDLRFPDVEFQEVTNFRTMAPGDYIFYVINQNRTILLSSELRVKNTASYTMYLFNWNPSSPDAITAIVVQER